MNNRQISKQKAAAATKDRVIGQLVYKQHAKAATEYSNAIRLERYRRRSHRRAVMAVVAGAQAYVAKTKKRARLAHLAHMFFRGTPYSFAEQSNREGNAPDWRKLHKTIATIEPTITLEEVIFWSEGGVTPSSIRFEFDELTVVQEDQADGFYAATHKETAS